MTNAIKTYRLVQSGKFGGCPVCGGTATIDAEYAAGEQRTEYGIIADGELVRFHYIRCGKCGLEQWS